MFLRRKFRPWALLTPILVLLIALPLLRPLRAPAGASPSESMLLDTVRSLSARGSLALDPARWRGQPGTVVSPRGQVFADRPPTFAVLLAAPAWAMRRAHLNFGNDASIVAYMLTLIGTTLPVAVGGGLIYRMGRLFELSRRRRALLALLVTFGSGWISYATVLNPHAPAAACVVGAATCLLWLAAAKRSANALPITLLAGLLCATAAALSPWTLPLVVPLPLVLFAMQIPMRQRVIGFVMMTAGAMPLAWVHSAWSLDAFGSVFPPGSVRTLTGVVRDPLPNVGVRVGVRVGDASAATPASDAAAAAADADASGNADGMVAADGWARAGTLAGSLFTVTLGAHGLLTHFPLVIVGLAGVTLVLRKHWPTHAKMLAGVTLAAAVTIVGLVALRPAGVDGWMFAVQWFVAFGPLLAFWSGAVLRRDLRPRARFATIAACGLSVIVGVAGALAPLPAGRPYTTHTAVGAIERWVGLTTAAGAAGEDVSTFAAAR